MSNLFSDQIFTDRKFASARSIIYKIKTVMYRKLKQKPTHKKILISTKILDTMIKNTRIHPFLKINLEARKNNKEEMFE